MSDLFQSSYVDSTGATRDYSTGNVITPNGQMQGVPPDTPAPGVINTSGVPIASAAGAADAAGQTSTFLQSYWYVFAGIAVVILLLVLLV